MRLDRPWAKFRSKWCSNWLLIDIFDPNLGVQPIVATISIRIRTQISILKSKFESEFWSNLIENNNIYPKRQPKLTILAQIWPIFDIKDQFRLNNWHLIDINRLKDWFYIKKDWFKLIYIENRSILYQNRDRQLDFNRWNPNRR